MSKYMRSISEGDFLSRAAHDSGNILKRTLNVITLPKDMYKLFNEFQLTKSRLWPIKQYQYLVQEIRVLNSQLREWKENNGPQIKNLRMTYYFYENLYSRIQYINSLSPDKQSAKKSLIQIIKWYNDQKPKVRGVTNKKPQAILKPSKADLLQEMQLQDMTQFTMRKRQMTPYQKMARTAHTNFFPPKQRLLDYHKKQFILDDKLTINNDQLRETRQAQTSSFKRASSNLTDQKLRETSNTFRYTKTTFRDTTVSAFNSNTHKKQSISQIKQVRQNENEQNQLPIQVKQFTLQQGVQEVDKIVQQEDMINNLINEQNYEEDEKDDQEYIQEESQQKSKYKKSYQTDHKPEGIKKSILNAQEAVKDAKQSTLRRILQSKQTQLQQKLQDLNIKQNLCNWAKTASFHHQQLKRKAQTYRVANDFQKVEFKKKGFFQKRKQIPLFDLNSQRAKTAQQKIKSIEETYQRRKIDNAIKNFGKYIGNHIKVNPLSQESQQNQEIRIMRATSLTSFNKKPKRKNFGDILAENQVDRYNEDIQNQITHLKDRLSKKLINVNKKKIHSALTAVKTQRLDDENIFPKTLSLFSNPFFPKHLYEKKKKKKK